MLYFLLAVLSSTLVSVLMRASDRHARNKTSMLACNYLVCTALAASFMGNTPFFSAADGGFFSMALGFFSGVLYLVSFLMLQWNIGRNGVALPSTYMKLGVLVPTIMAITVFGEKPQAAQILGIILAVLAIVLIQSEKGNGRTGSQTGLLVLLLCGGLTDGMAKIFEYWGTASRQGQYLFFTFGVALMLCILLSIHRKQGLGWQDALFGILIGVPNYFSSWFLLLSLKYMPAVVVYPGFSVGTIVLVTLIGAVCFRERLSRRQLVAVGIIVAALALLNL